jgi:septin family protein
MKNIGIIWLNYTRHVKIMNQKIQDKIYVIGPNFSGKTSFIQKMFGRDVQLFKGKILESVYPPENVDDALHIYLLMPEKYVLEARGGKWTPEDEELYNTFYYQHADVTVIVKDFR